jgi:hypothetical protein
MGDVFFPLPVPSSPPDEGDFFYPAFGVQWLPAIIGKLQELKDPTLWLEPPDDLIPQIDELIARMCQVTDIAGSVPSGVALFPHMATLINGNPVTVTVVTTQEFNLVGAQTAAAVNDRLGWAFPCQAGDFTVRVNGRTFNSAGKVDWYFDGELVATGQDWYSASTVNNVTKTFTITIPEDGIHTLESLVASKHASSSGYSFQLSSIMLKLDI